MDELDKKLYHDLSLKIKIPNKCRIVILESLYNEKNIKRIHCYTLSRIAITICASLLLTAGTVYAGTKLYEKIWNTPEKTIGFYDQRNSEKYSAINETTEDTMTEEEAKKKANELLKEFGHREEIIESVNLENNSNNYELLWQLKTNKGNTILLNARGSKDFSLSFDSILNVNNLEQYMTTRENAEKTARNLCEKYGYNIDEYTYVRIYSNTAEENEAYIWYIDFIKQYNETINPFEKISIGFIPKINEIYYFATSNTKCENNPIEITKEQAQQIVYREEQKINTKYPIKEIKAQLCIDSNNGNAYLRTNNYEQYRKQSFANYPLEDIIEYRIDRRVRRVWAVTIKYDIPETEDKFSESFNICDECFTYLVDATTGEIIGGIDDYESSKKLLFE